LQVPVPPSTQDFTKTQYSYTDGFNSSTISDWHQLATPEEEYNYVVTHYYNTDIYTGSEKLLSDPQVQMSDTTATLAEIEAIRNQVAIAETALELAKEANKNAEETYKQAVKDLSSAQVKATKLESYMTLVEDITACTYAEGDESYTVTAGGANTKYVSYDDLADTTQADEIIADLIATGALKESYATDKAGLYFAEDGSSFVYQSELSNLSLNFKSGATLKTYNSDKAEEYQNDITTKANIVSLAEITYKGADGNGGTLASLAEAQADYDDAVKKYSDLEHPEYIGNCELKPLGSLDKDQRAEIDQILKDMAEEDYPPEITKCFNEDGEYLGGIYQFKLNGVVYYTTYNDLNTSYLSGTGINNIDGQQKLPYYNASYVSTKIEKTEKALLETDGAGRFVSVRFEDDSITYTLHMETITDDVAYQDAMNQYYYENAKYDKMVQDINAKTSIIQRQDQQLELRLKQLDTEQRALSTEVDAVQKVVNDNIDKSFKTFGG